MGMKAHKLIENAADWTNQNWMQRLDSAASLLFIHGYLSPAQREKITHKIEREIEAGLASGEIRHATQGQTP